MAATCIMKQVEDRHIANEITRCVWSPKMDLVAIANVQGQVAMHRLSWQRVWVVSCPGEGVKVTGLAWRPDSKVLAVGYTSGEVALLDIEDSSSIHRLTVGSEVSCLSWALHQSPPTQHTSDFQDSSETYLPPLPSLSKTYSGSGPGVEDREEAWHEGRLLRDQSALTLLTVGSVSAEVRIYAFGLFHCATVKLYETIPGAGRVLDAAPSHDLHMLSCLVERECGGGNEDVGKRESVGDMEGLQECVGMGENVGGRLRRESAGRRESLQESGVGLRDSMGRRESMGGKEASSEREVVQVTVETMILAHRHQELRALAYRYGQIYGLMTYAAHTLTLLDEAWESILLELDQKLATYANTVPEGGVSADFLDLLVFGISSLEFDKFLSDELTEKGLKKLGHSIELSYSNIQKLVLRNVQAVGQALVYQLSALVGLSRHQHRFGVLGVEEDVVSSAMGEAGAFVLKAVELQQVIDGSMSTFKTFLRWVYVVVQRVRGEAVPEEMSRITQQDLTYITEFLHDSLEDVSTGSDGERRPRFRLERVGQYLKDAPLSTPVDDGCNPWVSFLEEHPALADHPLIFPHHRERSLLQELRNLATVLNDMAHQPEKVISKAVNVVSWVPFMALSPTTLVSVSQISCPQANAMYTVLLPGPKLSVLYLARWSTVAEHLTRGNSTPGSPVQVEAAPFVFSQLEGSHGSTLDQPSSPSPLLQLIGAQFYTQETLSVLAQDPSDPKTSFFIQLWMLAACGELRPLTLHGRLAEAGITPRDAGTLVDSSGYRRLEGGPLAALCVSGSRKVALLLSENRRRVRLFEMEVEEDDEDEEDDSLQHQSSIMNVSGASEEH